MVGCLDPTKTLTDLESSRGPRLAKNDGSRVAIPPSRDLPFDLLDFSAGEKTTTANPRFVRLMAHLVLRHFPSKGYTNRVMEDLHALGVLLQLKTVQDRITAIRRKYHDFSSIEAILESTSQPVKSGPSSRQHCDALCPVS